MERSPGRARRPGAAKPDSLRYLGAPGLRAWPALPERDRALLRWLVVGSAVTAELAGLLAYGPPRTARRRLHRLVEEGLLRGAWAANRQRPRGRYAYSLVGAVRAELEGRRAGGGGPRGGTVLPTIHELATHDLLAAFLRAARPAAGQGLVGWLPERAAAALFDGYLRPDAIARIASGRGSLMLCLERDLGTETVGAVAAKVDRYRRVFRHPSRGPLSLGLVVDSARRSASIRRTLGRPAPGGPSVWIVLAEELLGDPLGAAWLGLDGERRSTLELPGTAVSDERPILGPLCLLEPEALEAFETPPAELGPVVGWRGKRA